MLEDFFYERLTKLRMTKGVSQREMSLAMGQSEGYMTKIESRVSLPSMTVFFYICEYFGISPREFFDDEVKNPALLQQAIDGLKTLSDDDLALILGNIKRLQEK
ncbi:MAG: helix-turn-helix transcriptional regulator [Eubacteriales bacterium]|nr:helix-turn-helix transcriptional regulator [Eubacteriales bacterium]